MKLAIACALALGSPVAMASPHPCEMLERLILKMNVTASNIANAESTRTPEGGPYRRKIVRCNEAGCEIEAQVNESKLVYNPAHPDASASGFVAYPAIDTLRELKAMIDLQKLYDSFRQDCIASR